MKRMFQMFQMYPRNVYRYMTVDRHRGVEHVGYDLSAFAVVIFAMALPFLGMYLCAFFGLGFPYSFLGFMAGVFIDVAVYLKGQSETNRVLGPRKKK